MRVLIADDDRVSRLAVQSLFERWPQAELVEVADGSAAWQALRRDPRFDLLCLDVRMPAPSGIELAQRVRATPEFEALPIVLVTAVSDRDTVLAATQLKVQGFIVKPVGDDAIERIARMIASFDAGVLEPQAQALARLGIDAGRYEKYLEAFGRQVRQLAEMAQPLAQRGAAPGLLQLAASCRTAAAMLGARRVERLVSDAIRDAEAAPRRAVVMTQLAAYWLDRVRRQRAAAAV
jgi:CheY-like chemotaxis protein